MRSAGPVRAQKWLLMQPGVQEGFLEEVPAELRPEGEELAGLFRGPRDQNRWSLSFRAPFSPVSQNSLVQTLFALYSFYLYRVPGQSSTPGNIHVSGYFSPFS